MSVIQNDVMLPLDLRYTDFLHALSDIHDENMRDRCHKYWTSLYRYLDRSMTNEQALIFEEKRIQDILHRLDIEIASRRSEVIYQIRDILQRGKQLLADFHIKYDKKKNNLREIKQNIDDLDNEIQRQKSEHSLTTTSSSISLSPITKIISNLKSDIKNLHITRENFQIELNTQKMDYFSSQIKIYHLQQDIHKLEKEFIEIQQKLTYNLQINNEQNNQLNQYIENLYILINQEYLNPDLQLFKNQLDYEQKLSFELKEQNNMLNEILLQNQIIFKTNKTKQSELNQTKNNLINKIQQTNEEIQNKKNLQYEIFKDIKNLNNELKRKNQILFTYHRQEHQLQNEIVQLEQQREKYLNQPIENLDPSTDNLKKLVHYQTNQRLKLTIVHYNLKYDINTYENTIKEYKYLVKDQREKIIYYEKLNDQWIFNLNSNRKRLLELFSRIDFIENILNNTKNFFQQFDQIKYSLQSNLLIFYHQMNLFIQQRKEKNGININKTSLNTKYLQLKQKEKFADQIKENLFVLNKNSSLLFNQILKMNKEKFHFIEYLNKLNKKFLSKKQDIFNNSKQLNSIEQIINLNKENIQKLLREKQNICSFLLRKQYLILFINKYIYSNHNNLIQNQLSYKILNNNIQRIRNQILNESQHRKSFQNQINFKQKIFQLQKELLEYKKKINSYQYRLHQYHRTQQILTNFDKKSIRKENYEQSFVNLQSKLSSIIYRLICKTHYNIILHKRLDLLMQNISLLYHSNQPLSNNSLYLQNSFQYNHLNNQLKSSIGELRLLKKEIFIYQQIYNNIKYSFNELEQKINNRNQTVMIK